MSSVHKSVHKLFVPFLNLRLPRAFAAETDCRFIEAMIKLCHEEVVNNNQKFPYQLSYEKIADTGGMTTKAVGKMVKQLKLQSKKSGVMYVEGLSARKLSHLCKMVGVREDEWLEGEAK